MIMHKRDDIHHKEIENHYKANQIMFSIFWSKNYLRYGFWDKKTKNVEEALKNVDKEVGRILQLKSGDKVLDAGCGVGGSVIYFAKNFDIHITGINISENQLSIGRKKAKAKANKLNEKVKFENQSFLSTTFKNSSFDKIYAIESIYHTHDTEKVIKEMYRILKPGGKIVIVDRFLAKENMNVEEKKSYSHFIKGQAVKKLPSLEGVKSSFKNMNFKKINYTNKIKETNKSIKKSTKYVKLSYPIGKILSKVNLFPKRILHHGKSLLEIEKLFEREVITYGIFEATK
jgi:tocopherol O-methyltransferase